MRALRNLGYNGGLPSFFFIMVDIGVINQVQDDVEEEVFEQVNLVELLIREAMCARFGYFRNQIPY